MKTTVAIMLFLLIFAFACNALAAENDITGEWVMTKYMNGNKLVEDPAAVGSWKRVTFYWDGTAFVTIGSGDDVSEYRATWKKADVAIDLTYEDGDTGVFTQEDGQLIYKTGKQTQYFSRKEDIIPGEYEYRTFYDLFAVPFPASLKEKDDPGEYQAILKDEKGETGLLYRFMTFSDANGNSYDEAVACYNAILRNDPSMTVFAINGHPAAMSVDAKSDGKSITSVTNILYIRDTYCMNMTLLETLPITAPGENVVVGSAAKEWAKLVLYGDEISN